MEDIKVQKLRQLSYELEARDKEAHDKLVQSQEKLDRAIEMLTQVLTGMIEMGAEIKEIKVKIK